MSLQHSHSSTPFAEKQFPITVLCDNVNGPANIGALFRICDAMGVERIIFGGQEMDLNSPRVKKTSRNTQTHINSRFSVDLTSEIQLLQKEGYQVVALEITDTSISLDSLMLTGNKVAMVIGGERNGISTEILRLIDQSVHIDMYGKNSSMNVVQAAGIALYSIVNKLK